MISSSMSHSHHQQIGKLTRGPSDAMHIHINECNSFWRKLEKKILLREYEEKSTFLAFISEIKVDIEASSSLTS